MGLPLIFPGKFPGGGAPLPIKALIARAQFDIVHRSVEDAAIRRCYGGGAQTQPTTLLGPLSLEKSDTSNAAAAAGPLAGAQERACEPDEIGLPVTSSLDEEFLKVGLDG